MLLKRFARFVPFCVTVALVAAAIADPIVEALSNAGVFGAGNYTDRSMADVAPVLSIGVLGALVCLFALVTRALGWWSAEKRRVWDERVRVPSSWLYPATLVLELGVLFTMETCEQLVLHGYVLGALTWLGGPVLASLAIHAFVTAIVTVALARGLRCGAIAIVTVVRFLARLVVVPTPRVASACALSYRFWRKRPLAPILCRIGERAPPLYA